MKYSITDISKVIQVRHAIIHSDKAINQLLIDSRKLIEPSSALFFALQGPRRDGHAFIPELYNKGVRNFVVSENVQADNYPDANFLFVSDTLDALQKLAAFHRNKFNLPVIGITGSNGKTIVKEWLYQLLHEQVNIVRSPRSYNSQIGVPLSVWQIEPQHTLGIFEAGISKPGEMEKLAAMIKPSIGIITNIGEAHSEGFSSQHQKLIEKLRLFRSAITVVMPGDAGIREIAKGIKCFCWGRSNSNDVTIIDVVKRGGAGGAEISLSYRLQVYKFTIPFIDDASIENAITCWCTLIVCGIRPADAGIKMHQLQAVNMRLELKKGINNCSIINDSYSADLGSLAIALNFLDQQSAGSKRTVILSDFFQTGLSNEKLYEEIANLLSVHKVNRIIGVGKNIGTYLMPVRGLTVENYPSTEDFLQHFRTSQFKEETILIKGARLFEFERIVQALEQKVHQTVLEIDLNAIVHNLKEFQKFLHPSTKVMAMVKAFAYGSGGAEIAGILQYHKVDYLGVAYADEGVELRKAGISLPVMVMNPEESSFQVIIDNNLEPDIYSFDLLQKFDLYLKEAGLQQYPVHIEIETGMNRLGFDTGYMQKLSAFLLQTKTIKVQTAFSHLAASEDPAEEAFTMGQYKKFIAAADELESKLGYSFIKHIANTAAIILYPALQMDMVRLGIGMYGVNSAGNALPLQTVATLRSTIAQIKHLKAGESVSYNRKGVVKKDSVIATIRIGYADGYPRRLGNGVGKMYVNGKLAPVIGTVCMDMTMIDVTDITGVKEGDDVIIFGKELLIEKIAGWAKTIAYEIMTGISQRVKRVYFEE